MQNKIENTPPQMMRAEAVIHKVKLFNEVHALQDKRFLTDAIASARYEKYISLCREMEKATQELREFNQTLQSLKIIGAPFTIKNGLFYV